jgi:GT2 family glycosyltransferase
VIPTRNGATTLPALLDAIDRQSRRPDEVIAVDSGSNDGTCELLRDRGVRVLSIRSADFNHGTARNAGIESATGDLVVLTVQDAVPTHVDWIDALTRPLEDDPSLAGTYARQVPAPNASAITRWNLERWAASGTEPRVEGPLEHATFAALTPRERLDVCIFDNVCSCIRKRAWERHPFKFVPIAEDLEWARDVLLDGWRTAFVPAACVAHSHDRGAAYEWRRTYLVHRRLMELFGLSTIPSMASLVASIASCAAQHARIARRERTLRDKGRAAALAIAWPAGQYFGARDARRGAPQRTIAGV